MARKYRRYTKEFKLKAVRLAEEADKPTTQVTRKLGIWVNPLYKCKQQREHKQDDAIPGKGKQLGKDAELTRLRKEVVRLRQQNDIIKKVAGN